MREHWTATSLGDQHQFERPEIQKNLPAREVVLEQGANRVSEITVERDAHGRISKKTTKELQRSDRGSVGDESYRLPDLTDEQRSITVEQFNYDTDTGRLLSVVAERFSGLSPDRAYYTKTLEYKYTDGGEVEEVRRELKGISGIEPLTHVSKVSKWEDGRAAEFAIEDGLTRGEPVKRIRRTRTYDGSGRVATEIDFQIADSGLETEKHAYTMRYDDDGRLLEVQHRYKGGTVMVSRFTYEDGEAGQRVETRRTYDKDGREGMGERVTLGKHGEKLRYEAWYSPEATLGDTTWTTKE